MKNKKLFGLLVLSSLALTGCGNEGKGGDENEDVYSDLKTLTQVVDRTSFSTFKANTNESQTEGISKFVDLTKPYLVGTDNAFKLGPSLTYVDQEDYVVLHSNRTELLTKGWKVVLKEGGQVIEDSNYQFDTKTCEIKLGSTLENKTVTATVSPNLNENQGITEANVGSFTTEFTFKVVGGFNLYNAKELYYLDNRPNTRDLYSTPNDDSEFNPNIDGFKAANGLDRNYQPSRIIFHNDISVTSEDFPERFFYTESELNGSWKQYAGSMKDRTFLFERTEENDVTLEGNYFQFDLSKLPLSYRENGKDNKMGEGGSVAHQAVFYVAGGSMEINNLNITGNAGNYVTEGDEKFAGGAIFIKAARKCQNLSINNVLCRRNFISLMSEDPDEGYKPANVTITNSKLTDNYNSFLYNYGGEITASNSLFHGCGGPIVIQDHTACGETGPWESPAGDVAYGFAPKTSFNGCTLDNYVIGQEAWFKQFGATSLAGTIKSMSDLYALQGGKSYLASKVETKNADGEVIKTEYVPTTYGDGTLDSQTYFNFIVLNKSCEAQGMTAYPVCGEVNITENSETTTFNYLKADNLDNYVTHIALRQLNSNGAPIFETKGGSAAIIDMQSPSLVSLLDQKDIKAGMELIYNTAVQVLAAKYTVDAMNLTDEAKVREIVRGDEYLVKFAIQFMVRPEVAKILGQEAVNQMSDENVLIVAMDVAAGGDGSGTTIGSYENARAMLLQAYASDLAQLRQIMIVANILETGKILSEELGLISIVDYYKGVSGTLEPTVEEAVSHFFGTQYEIKDGVLTPTAETAMNDNFISIAQVANRFKSDGKSLADAQKVAAQIGSGDTTTHFFDQATNYTALYYNGMMLVFGLNDLVIG